MRVLIYEIKDFGVLDVVETLKNMGHEVLAIEDDRKRERVNAEFDSDFDIKVESFKPDLLFTFNYSPIISNACMRHDLPYVAYVYDSPQVLLYSCTLINKNNHVFIFDKAQFEELSRQGINTVYHCPLACNVDRVTRQIEAADRRKYDGDIAFVGQLYNEEHNFFDRLHDLNEYTRGYLDAIMEAQLGVYGEYFIPKLLTPEIVADMQKSVPVKTNKYGVETVEYIYSDYFIARKLATMERNRLLNAVSKQFSINVYTPGDISKLLPLAAAKGKVDYYEQCPLVFHDSKINLNITLRSIRTGIPLRAIDVMGAGGFLLSNYQSEFYDFFEPGSDMVIFESEQDLLDKCRYYLAHDAERAQIAANGLGKIKDNYTYKNILTQMLEIAMN